MESIHVRYPASISGLSAASSPAVVPRGLLVGGAIVAIVVDVGLQAWSIFHTFVWSGSQTAAVVAAGIWLFPFWVTGIFLIAAVAGLIASVVTALEALWRPLFAR